jgi:hypothetical protein
MLLLEHPYTNHSFEVISEFSLNMGKVKKGKKHSHQPKALGKLLLSSDRIQEEHEKKIQEKYNLSELHSNLNSLAQEKRLNASRILSDIYQFNQQNEDALLALTNPAMMNSLLCRLMDNSLAIQVHTSNSIRILSESKFKSIIERVISQGILRTMLSFVMTKINWSLFIQDSSQPAVTLPVETEFNLSLFQNLLYSIGTIFSEYPQSMQEMNNNNPASPAVFTSENQNSSSSSTTGFIPLLFQILQTQAIHLRVINTILNVFILLTKVSSEHWSFLSNHNIQFQVFPQLFNSVLFEKISNAPTPYNQHSSVEILFEQVKSFMKEFNDFHYDNYILLLQLLEINCNICLNQQADASQTSSFGYYWNILLYLLEVFVQKQRQEVHRSVQEIAADIQQEKGTDNAEEMDMEMETLQDEATASTDRTPAMSDSQHHNNRRKKNSSLFKKEREHYLSSVSMNKMELIEVNFFLQVFLSSISSISFFR